MMRAMREMTTEPRVRVLRQSFFRATSSAGGARGATWTEHHPVAAPGVARSRRGPLDVASRPAGAPTDVRQEVRFLWPGCSIALEDGISMPWVTFRRSGDVEAWHARRTLGEDGEAEDHAYFIFDASQPSARVEIASPGLGIPGLLATNVLVGDRVDPGRLSRALSSSAPLAAPSDPGIDSAGVGAGQVWLHGAPWIDATRILECPEETHALAEAMRAAANLRERALPRARDVASPMRDVRRALEKDSISIALADHLRQMLEPFALHAEHTELFARAREMYAQEVRARIDQDALGSVGMARRLMA